MTDLVLAAGTRAAGPLGLVLILVLGVATVLLIRNMDKRVKRLPREFPAPPPRGRAATPAERPDGPPAV